MKKVYQKITVRTVELSPDGALLKGSATFEPIELPATIQVKEFENGFETDDFEIELK